MEAVFWDGAGRGEWGQQLANKTEVVPLYLLFFSSEE
jgi:hypothetical protein